MITLLNVKSYDDISIKDICDESGISREHFINTIEIKMTFYFNIKKS